MANLITNPSKAENQKSKIESQNGAAVAAPTQSSTLNTQHSYDFDVIVLGGGPDRKSVV